MIIYVYIYIYIFSSQDPRPEYPLGARFLGGPLALRIQMGGLKSCIQTRIITCRTVGNPSFVSGDVCMK